MIIGKNIILRAINRNEIQLLRVWREDPEISKNLGKCPRISKVQQEKWFEKLIKDKSKKKFIIEKKATKKPVGLISLMNIDTTNKHVEIGITIGDKKEWGKGTARESMLLLLRFVFDEWNFNRVYLKVYEFNKRAIKFFKKLGFNQDGVLKDNYYSDNQYWDTIIMSLSRNEFIKNNKKGD